MMIDIYHVDTFNSNLFKGNPAAVCLLEQWLMPELLWSIANENYLPATAFVIRKNEHFDLRFFNPFRELEICSHSIIACALVIFQELGYEKDLITFQCRGGEQISVRKDNKFFILNFPADTPLLIIDYPAQLEEAFNCKIIEVYKGDSDYMVIVNSQRDVEALQPYFKSLNGLDAKGVIVTAPGDEVDFVSRYFSLQFGAYEDAVTCSSHTLLIPYWAQKLDKHSFYARQLSKRGGTLKCKLENDHVEIGGTAKLYLKGQIFLE